MILFLLQQLQVYILPGLKSGIHRGISLLGPAMVDVVQFANGGVVDDEAAFGLDFVGGLRVVFLDL